MRTEHCGLVTNVTIGEKVILFGWVHRIRRHPNVTFIELRGREGATQVIFHRKYKTIIKILNSVREGCCLRVSGLIQHCNLRSRDVEVLCYEAKFLSESEVLPFHNGKTSEETRLKLRFLDIRSTRLKDNLLLRHRTCAFLNRYLSCRDFINIETPVLAKGTLEGAKEYSVPVRQHPGKSFSLPQSPQIFKQLLMIGGIERYYQLAKCFRDEDLRADRQPEFSQVDCEVSFLKGNDIMTTTSALVGSLLSEINNTPCHSIFPTLTYSSIVKDFGNDKPDLRIILGITRTISNLTGVVVLRVCHCHISNIRSQRFLGSVKDNRNSTINWAKVIDEFTNLECNDTLRGPVRSELGCLLLKHTAESEVTLFFTLDFNTKGSNVLGELIKVIGSSVVGRSRGLFRPGWRLIWLVRFPLFKFSRSETKLASFHHLFANPDDSFHFIRSPLQCKSESYDIIFNGYEVGGGSVRINNPRLQNIVMSLLSISHLERQKMEFFLNALKYGAPSHGGIALGLDRLLMIVSFSDSLRDVIAFPKTQRASCSLMGTPD